MKSGIFVKILSAICSIGLFLFTTSTPVTWAQPGTAELFPNLELIVLLDESNSMYAGTDPNDFRGSAVELLARTLGVDFSNSSFRLGLITFATDAVNVSNGFVDLKDKSSRENLLRQMDDIRRYDPNGYTDVLKGLQAAQQLMKDHKPGYKPVIVILSDGMPETSNANSRDYPANVPGYLQSITDFLQTGFQDYAYDATCATKNDQGNPVQGIPVYTAIIRINEQFYSAQEKTLWLNIAEQTGGGYAEVVESERGLFQEKLQTVLTEFMPEWLCANVETPQRGTVSKDQPFVRKFKVQPNYAHFVVVVNQPDSAPMQVTLLMPNGKAVQFPDGTQDSIGVRWEQTSDGRSQIWAVQKGAVSAWEGDWEIQVQGQEQTSVVVMPIYGTENAQLTFLDPTTQFVPKQPQQTVVMQIQDPRNNQFIRLTSETTATVQVYQAGALVGPPVAGTIDTESSTISAVINQPSEGDYELYAQVTLPLDGQLTTISQVKRLTAQSKHYFEIVQPQPRYVYQPGEPLRFEALLMREGLEQDASVGSYSGEVQLSRVDQNNGGSVFVTTAPLLLEQANGHTGRFVVEIDASTVASGAYKAVFSLEGSTIGGEEFSTYKESHGFAIQLAATETLAAPASATWAATSTATATPTPTPAPTPPAPPKTAAELITYLAALFGLFVVVAPLIYMIYWSQKPTLAGISLNQMIGGESQPPMFEGKKSQKKTYTQDIIDDNEELIARLVLIPHKPKPLLKFTDVQPDTQIRHGHDFVEAEQAFLPTHGDYIRVGKFMFRYENDNEPNEPIEDDADDSDA